MRKSLAIGLALCLLAGTAHAQDWFDAYARGLAALKQGDGVKAADWLERAARKRPEPGTNILTYGTNRLDRYHPYLHLAEAYLLAGKPEEARAALERSEAKGKEPAAERERLRARVDAEIEKRRVAQASPPPTAAVTAPPTQAPTATAAATAAPTSAPATAPPTAAPAGPTAAAAANGILEIESDPAGATVFLGAQLVGTTPLRIEVAPGSYDVALRKEGAAEVRFPVRVNARRTTRETRALVMAPTPAAAPATVETAGLVIVTHPPGVSVYVDDVPLGTTDPVSGRLVKGGLEAGRHRVRLSRPGFADVAEEIDLPAGPATTFEKTLNPAGWSLSPAVVVECTAALLVVIALFFGWRHWRRRQAAAVPIATPLSADPSATTTSKRTAVGAPTIKKAEAAAARTAVDGMETAALPTPVTPGGRSVSGTKGLDLPARFGDYMLLSALGRGGMASVFKAERRGEICALKRPLSAFLEDPEFLERFLREADIGRTLHHPNIIRIFERGEVDGVPYFTMELVEGETLQARVKREGALDARRATEVVARVAEALDYAHLKGVIHRDLKPSNIMIGPEGAVKVMDYGIARARRFEGLTVTGAFLGTPDYVAPETAEGKGTDARSDLYSLGIVFFEIVTGRRPFSADTPFATLRKHCTEPPPPPSSLNAAVPAPLEAIILRLLSKNPDDRHPGAEELLIELRDFLNRAA